MNRERLSDDVYVFTSERYAQVTASLIVSGTYGVLVDTLPFPDETLQMGMFARKVCPDGIRYIIYTQHQADHTYGAFLFPRAEVIAHAGARRILSEKGPAALEQARAASPDLAPVRLRLPTLTFVEGSLTIRLPGKTLEVFATPGHTDDSVSVLLQEEKILFAGDTFMSIPTISEGDPEQLKASIEKIAAMSLDTIVQGHGEIILRGEIKENVRRSLAYLDALQTKVQKLVDEDGSREQVRAITLESCGLHRVLLNGMVVPLHTANLLALYDKLAAKHAASKPAPVLPRPEPPKPAPKPAVKKPAPAKTPAKKAAPAAKPSAKKPAAKPAKPKAKTRK